MEHVTIDGHRCRVHRAGDGAPLVYLHSGWGEAGELPLFGELIDAGFAVYAPELPGFGRSEPVVEWHGIADVVFTLRRVLDTLGVDNATVVGSSLGGWLAAELGVWFPERVRHMVLISPFGLRIEGYPIFDVFAGSRDEVVSRVLPNGGSLTDLLRPAFADHDDPNALMLHYFHAVEATARIGWNPFLHDPKLADRLPFVTAPTLVLYGTDDGIVPRAHADAYAVEIPTARLELLPGSGHLPALERPAEVAAAIAAFTQGS